MGRRNEKEEASGSNLPAALASTPEQGRQDDGGRRAWRQLHADAAVDLDPVPRISTVRSGCPSQCALVSVLSRLFFFGSARPLASHVRRAELDADGDVCVLASLVMAPQIRSSP